MSFGFPRTTPEVTRADLDTATSTLVLSASISGALALGSASRTVDGVTSKLLVKPTANDEGGITFKVPSATYGVSPVAYGKGTPFQIHKFAVAPSDIGISGTTPDDFILWRANVDGSMGMGGNLHLATGLRQPSSYASNYAAFVNPHLAGATGIYFRYLSTLTQTGPFMQGDSPGGVAKWKITAGGNATFGMDASARGMSVGDAGTGSGYMAVANSAVFGTNGTSYALLQGPTGDTILNSASGKSLAFRIANATRMSISDTLVAPQVEEFRVVSNKLGFYNTTGITKPTGVAVTAAGIHAALVSLGLIAA